MVTKSVLTSTSLESPLLSVSPINPKGHGSYGREISAPLMLTSLVDAFSILVIYLLMHFSASGEILMVSKNTELPKAANTADLIRDTIIKVEDGRYFVEDQEVTQDGLVGKLLELRQTFTKDRPGEEFPDKLIVQADRRTPYKVLNSIVQASAQTGYSEIKFAVISKR